MKRFNLILLTLLILALMFAAAPASAQGPDDDVKKDVELLRAEVRELRALIEQLLEQQARPALSSVLPNEINTPGVLGSAIPASYSPTPVDPKVEANWSTDIFANDRLIQGINDAKALLGANYRAGMVYIKLTDAEKSTGGFAQVGLFMLLNGNHGYVDKARLWDRPSPASAAVARGAGPIFTVGVNSGLQPISEGLYGLGPYTEPEYMAAAAATGNVSLSEPPTGYFDFEIDGWSPGVYMDEAGRQAVEAAKTRYGDTYVPGRICITTNDTKVTINLDPAFAGTHGFDPGVLLEGIGDGAPGNGGQAKLGENATLTLKVGCYAFRPLAPGGGM